MVSDFEIAEQVINARGSPLKIKLIHLLNIYGELSTLELATKSGKSKPTVLKHLEELVEIGEVSKRSEISPGAYDRNMYSLVESQPRVIRGQELIDDFRKKPELAIKYATWHLYELLQVKDIVDSMVEYQSRLIEEVEKEIDDIDQVFEIMKDNLGSRRVRFATKKDIFGKGDNEKKEFMKIELILPVRRVIEQLAKDEWELDGSLWPRD